MLLRHYWLPVLSALSIVTIAHAEERSASWFADHPQQRAAVAVVCNEYASQAHTNPNCDNAFQGGLIAANRDAQRRTATANNGGISNLGGPPLSFWRDPANADNRAFWAGQCRKAEAMHRSAEAMNAMWCPSIKAAGGY